MKEHTHAHALMPVTLQATSLQWSFTRYTECNQQLLLLSSYFGTAESQSVHRAKWKGVRTLWLFIIRQTGHRTTATSRTEHPVTAEEVTVYGVFNK